MANPYHAMCAELLQELCCHYRSWELKEGYYSDVMKRANALLVQPETEGMTDQEIPDNYAGHEKSFAQEHLARLMRDAIGTETSHNAYIVAAGKILDRPEFAYVARWGRPTPRGHQ